MPKNKAYYRSQAEKITVNEPAYAFFGESTARDHKGAIDFLKANKDKSTDELLRESETKLESLRKEKYQIFADEYLKVLNEQLRNYSEERANAADELNDFQRSVSGGFFTMTEEERKKYNELDMRKFMYQEALAMINAYRGDVERGKNMKNIDPDHSFSAMSVTQKNDSRIFVDVGISSSDLNEKFKDQLSNTNKEIKELETRVKQLNSYKIEEKSVEEVAKKNIRLAAISKQYLDAKESFEDRNPIVQFFAKRLHPFFLPKSWHEAYEEASKMAAYKEVLDKAKVGDPQKQYDNYKDRIPPELLEEPKDEEVVNENPEIENDRVVDPMLTEDLKAKTNTEAEIQNGGNEMTNETVLINEKEGISVGGQVS